MQWFHQRADLTKELVYNRKCCALFSFTRKMLDINFLHENNDKPNLPKMWVSKIPWNASEAVLSCRMTVLYDCIVPKFDGLKF